jgi:hypothetical protein
MKKLVPLLLILAALSSCRPSRTLCNQLYPPVADTTSQSSFFINTETDIDTILIPADTSAWIQALFECDSAGNAVIASLKSQFGLRSSLQINTNYQGKRIIETSIRCKCDSATIYHIMQSRDTVSRSVQTITKTIPVPVPADLTWWQKFKVAYGGYAMGILLAYILLRVGWWALKTYTKIQLPFTNFL